MLLHYAALCVSSKVFYFITACSSLFNPLVVTVKDGATEVTEVRADHRLAFLFDYLCYFVFLFFPYFYFLFNTLWSLLHACVALHCVVLRCVAMDLECCDDFSVTHMILGYSGAQSQLWD